ncbi:MAG: phosphomannomutase/phosphoglucomutase [Candidatus Schekmanbacteria bacterium]|nr:phosphomannomutase/phosphoglucomutase [Candidatus Schekmanbacteria bacterium]
MNPQIFREYDIRGLVGTELTLEVVESIGKAYGTYLQEKNITKVVVVGHDNRLSSDEVSANLIKGILSTGCSVHDVGLVTTPLLYFSLFHLNLDGGVMVTGSHNPPEFNGFKLCQGKTTLHGEQIQEIYQIAQSGCFKQGRGERVQSGVIAAYKELVKSKVKLARPVKVVIDAGNGTASIIAPDLLKEMGCEVIELYCQSDGRFPNHHPDPTVVKNLQDLIAKVKSEKAELGIAYDGDADRIGAVDENGNVIWGDKLMIIFSRNILSKHMNASVIFEVKCSQTLFDDIKQHGGVPIMWKTGHSLIKKKMKETGALLAGEMSGHIFFADDYFGYDDAVYASCRLLEIVAQTKNPVSSLLSGVPNTFVTPEIRVECADADKFQIIKQLSDYFRLSYNIIDIDGVRILFENGWGLIRASNTQPVLVLRFEADSEKHLADYQKIVWDKLTEYSSVKRV